MAANQTCETCGTVNVVSAGRCIACATPFSAPQAAAKQPDAVEDDTTGSVEPPQEAAPPAPRRESPPPTMSQTVPVRIDPEIAAAAARGTAVHPSAPGPERPAVGMGTDDADARDEDDAEDDSVTAEPAAPPAKPPAPARTVAAGDSPAPPGEDRERFVVRLLLPEGDKRLVEVGSRKVALGSGLDELGLSGDPRVRSREACIYVHGGRLWIEPGEISQGVYRRITGEETLTPGDVVLTGDVAAAFDRLPPGPPVDPDLMAVGGAANSPCGRLTFLRRDGSAGPVHDLPAGKTVLGRTDGHINFPGDSRLSRRHARFVATEAKVTVEDLDSRNGTYLRIRRKTALDVGDALRIGSSGLQIRGRA